MKDEKKWRKVWLAIDLIDEVDEMVKTSSGYNSRAEFIREAIRNQLKEMKRK